MDCQQIASIERELSLNPSILRHMFVKEVYRKVKRRPFAPKDTAAKEVEEHVEDKDTDNSGN